MMEEALEQRHGFVERFFMSGMASARLERVEGDASPWHAAPKLSGRYPFCRELNGGAKFVGKRCNRSRFSGREFFNFRVGAIPLKTSLVSTPLCSASRITAATSKISSALLLEPALAAPSKARSGAQRRKVAQYAEFEVVSNFNSEARAFFGVFASAFHVFIYQFLSRALYGDLADSAEPYALDNVRPSGIEVSIKKQTKAERTRFAFASTRKFWRVFHGFGETMPALSDKQNSSLFRHEVTLV